MIVIVEKNKDGKIVVTEEQLKQWLEEARAEGYREGSQASHFTPPNPATPWAPGIRGYEPDPWRNLEVPCDTIGTTPDATSVLNSKTTTNAATEAYETAKTINYHGEPLESVFPDATKSSSDEWFNSVIKDLSQNTLSNS